MFIITYINLTKITALSFFVLQLKSNRKSSPLPWNRIDKEVNEEKKCFPTFPKNQCSPPTSPIRNSLPSPESTPLHANGERRGRGRPPKNWPWGKVKDQPRPGPGRPRKIRPKEDDDEEYQSPNKMTPVSMSPSPPFSSEKEPNCTERLIGTSRLSALPLSRNRGRPVRNRGGPKRRLSEESGDDVPSLTMAPRLSESPVPHSCSSETSEEDDHYNEEMGARSPPVLTKPTLGLKSKVGKNWIQ